MNDNEVEALLIEMIMNIVKKEREIEITRQYLNEIEEFEPFAAFTRIDRKDKKILTEQEFLVFLGDNHHISTEKNKLLVRIFVEFYDLNRQGGLSFDE